MQVLAGSGRLFVATSLIVASLGMSSGSAMSDQGMQAQRNDEGKPSCTYFGNPEQTSARHKFVIRQPGRYCLTEHLHARIELADHPAEDTMIAIWSGDVVLDLQGHTLGRGLIFKNPGGHGIEIVDPDNFNKGTGAAKNIVIRNGTLQDFDTGVFFADRWPSTISDIPTFDQKTNTYYFPASNVTLENITFMKNKDNFKVLVPHEPRK